MLITILKLIILSNKTKVYKELKDYVSYYDLIWLAPDEDREGEAIAWHLKDALNIPESKIRRITFNEITKNAVCNSLNNPRNINMNLVNAQQARRSLDRLVGFELSPVLWKYFNTYGTKLSAGRVQSVATRLVYDRIMEIENFVSDKYIKVDGELVSSKNISLNIDYPVNITGTYQSYIYFKFLKENKYEILKVLKSNITEEKRHPPPPFTTSTLQQDASVKHSISSKATMESAQKLYEAGLITYMRTDSTTLSDVALGMIKKEVVSIFGEEHYQFRNYKTKSKGAQEAHEAIRPTYMNYKDLTEINDDKLKIKDGFNDNMNKIYKLIWKRTMASQMNPSLYDVYSAEYQFVDYDIKKMDESKYNKLINENKEFKPNEITKEMFDNFKNYFSNSNNYVSKYRNMTYPGFQLVYGKSKEANKENDESENDCLNKRLIKFLTEMKENDLFKFKKLNAMEKETNSKPRYTEASLVKSLEDKQIGRPSTYANIISTILDREYVMKKTIPATSKNVNVLSIIPGNDSIENNSITKKVASERNKLIITDIGKKVVEFLLENFSNIMDYKFTASMEEKLDLIASGDLEYVNVMREFYDLFHPSVEKMLSSSINNSKISVGGEKKSNNKRLLGIHPVSNKEVHVLTAKYGNVVMIGENKDVVFAPIYDKTLSIEEVTLEEALDIVEKYQAYKKNQEPKKIKTRTKNNKNKK
jgi:DNA topoisomerase-1